MDEFDKALEDLFAPSTPTATPGATTATPSARTGNGVETINNILKEAREEARKRNSTARSTSSTTATPGATTATPSTTTETPGATTASAGNGTDQAFEDMNKILDKTGFGRITQEEMDKQTEETRKRKEEEERARKEAETKKKEKKERAKAAMKRKREARQTAFAEYEAEAKRKKSRFRNVFGNIEHGRKGASADSLGSNSLQIDELEWRSFNTWVVDLTTDLKNFSISFNQIVSKKGKKFEVEPLKNDGIYNSYNPVYVIHYFKDFWGKIESFYKKEKEVKLIGSDEVDRFIKTIDRENWKEYGWENPKFSTNPKDEELKLDKNNEVIKAFEGWLEIIKKNVTNLQDKIVKKNIEKYKGIDDKSVNDLWKNYGSCIKKYNEFVRDQNELVNEQKENGILSKLTDANGRKAQEIEERILNPIFSDGEFESLTPAKLLENFLTKEATLCKERGNLSDKYERLKAILDDAEMIEGAGELCKCLYDFNKKLSPDSKVNPIAKVLNQRTKNIRECFVDSKRAGELAGSFGDLLDAINDSIDKLQKVYVNVLKVSVNGKSIIGKDHEFSFGKDEKNCWHVYQNENGVEKKIGSIAEVYSKVVKKDEKQEVNVSLKDPNGEVTLYNGAFTYVRLSSYLYETQGYLSFYDNCAPGKPIECHYTDEEGKENSVTFNANGMAIEINRQGKEMKVNENSNTFKQLEQAFKGNQLSSTSPQGDLDINNNNEKNKGGINMETKSFNGIRKNYVDFAEKFNEFLKPYSKNEEDLDGIISKLGEDYNSKDAGAWKNKIDMSKIPEEIEKEDMKNNELLKKYVDMVNIFEPYLISKNKTDYANDFQTARLHLNTLSDEMVGKAIGRMNEVFPKMLVELNSTLEKMKKEANGGSFISKGINAIWSFAKGLISGNNENVDTTALSDTIQSKMPGLGESAATDAADAIARKIKNNDLEGKEEVAEILQDAVDGVDMSDKVNSDSKEDAEKQGEAVDEAELEKAKKQLRDFVEKYNYFSSLRGDFARKYGKTQEDRKIFNESILRNYQEDWWGKYEKYELGDLSDIGSVKIWWNGVIGELALKYSSGEENKAATDALYIMGTKFNSAKSNEEKLEILGKYNDEAKKLLGNAESVLENLVKKSKKIKSKKELDPDVKAALKPLNDFVSEYNKFLLHRGEFAEEYEGKKEIFNESVLKGYYGDWWNPFKEYTLSGDRSSIEGIGGQWLALCMDLTKYESKKGETTAQGVIKSINEKFILSENKDERLKILEEYHTEAEKLLNSAKIVLRKVNTLSEQFDSDGKMKSGVDLLKIFIKRYDEFCTRRSDFLEGEGYDAGKIIDEKFNGSEFNLDTWKDKESGSITDVKVRLGGRPGVLADDCRSVSRVLVKFFDEAKGLGKESNEFINTSNNPNFPSNSSRDTITNKGVETFGKMVDALENGLDLLEEAATNGGENVDKTNETEKVEQEKEGEATKVVEALKSEETESDETSKTTINDDETPPPPPEDDDKEETTETVDESKSKLSSQSTEATSKTFTKGVIDKSKVVQDEMIGIQKGKMGSINKFNKLCNRYNRFIGGCNDLVSRVKGKMVKILPESLKNNSNWSSAAKHHNADVSIQGYAVEKIFSGWSGLLELIVLWLPAANEKLFRTESNNIASAIDSKETDAEKLELMEGYNLLAKKALGYMEKVLARLNTKVEKLESGLAGKVLSKLGKGKEFIESKLGLGEKESERDLEEEDLSLEQEDGKYKDKNSSKVGETFKLAAQLLTKEKGFNITNFAGFFSGVKGFKGSLNVALTSSKLTKSWGVGNNDEDKKRRAAMGVLFVSMAHLPGGSESIVDACDGLKKGGLKGTGDDFVGHASKIRKFIKQSALKGITGDALVKELKSASNIKEDCEYFIKNPSTSISEISDKLKSGGLAKLGRKAKKAAKKAAKKIGKSSVGKAAKSAATTAGSGIKSAARSVKKGILKRIRGSKSKKDSVKQEPGVIDLEKPNNRKKSSFWVEEDE